MRFAPGTPQDVIDRGLARWHASLGRNKPKSQPETIINEGPVSKSPMLQANGAAGGGIAAAANPLEGADSANAAAVGGGGGGRRKKRRRQAGANFGLMPTEVIESTRGRGYGLTYSPQQRDPKQIKFGGGGPQNVINFNPIMSQQANPNIRIGVGGAEQTASPQFTASPIYESGPGSVYTGPNTGNFEEGPGYQEEPTVTDPIVTVNPIPGEPITQEPEKPGKKGGKKVGKKKPSKYGRLMERYMRRFDRTAYGAGSKRGKDRFSAKDVRIMTQAGRKFGGSKKQVARDILNYARDFRGKTKMGGGTRKALDRLQSMLGKRRSAEKKAKSRAAKKQARRKTPNAPKKQRSKAKALAKAFKRGGGKRGGGKRGGGKRGGKRR